MVRGVICAGIVVALVIGAGVMVPGGYVPGSSGHTSLPIEDGGILVAAYNSPAEVKVAADYFCDGVADQVEIQSALNALGNTGGTVTLTGGTFHLNGNLNIPGNVILEGQGPDATRLEWSSGLMQCLGKQNFVLRDFKTTGTGAIFIQNSAWALMERHMTALARRASS